MSSSSQVPEASTVMPAQRETLSLIDVTLAASTSGVAAAVAVGRRLGAVARPVAGTLLRPPMLAGRYQPETWLTGLARRGSRRRGELGRDLSALLDLLVPAVATALLRRIDLTEVVRRYVDLDRVVAAVDLDAVVARLDLNRIVRERVDLDMLVGTVDLDAAVGRVDLDAAVGRVDLDAAVGRVDLDGAVERVDLDAIIARIDLVGLAEEVIAAVDLPEIIRESTGSVASDTVRGFRMQSISGDEALGRAVDRIRLRRSRRDGIPPPAEPGPTSRP